MSRFWFARVLVAPGGPLLLLRAFLGVTFVFAGSQKLANPNFFSATAPAKQVFRSSKRPRPEVGQSKQVKQQARARKRIWDGATERQ